MSQISRRRFIRQTAALAAAAPIAGALRAAGPETDANKRKEFMSIPLRWLEGRPTESVAGVTWGVPWPRGMYRAEQAFVLRGEAGSAAAVQSWPLARWPDGSLKWSAHAIRPLASPPGKMLLEAAAPPPPRQAVSVSQEKSAIMVDTGALRCTLGTRGQTIFQSLARAGRDTALNGRLICLRLGDPDGEQADHVEQFTGAIEQATVEQDGPIRAVVRLRGKHVGADARAWLPFDVRLYFYAGSDQVRMMHTFVFDGDESRDFIRGLGVRFDVPMRDQLHDRHVRFIGRERGLWAEAVRGLTGLRRDPGQEVRQAQVDGKPTPPVASLPDNVRKRLHLIPAWGDYTLAQLSADGFEIRKRTKAGHGWIKSAAGDRASGVGYLGGISGGIAFGMRDFWQRHPTQLDIRNAATDHAEVTLWLYSPEALQMDLRFYHDGLGMETHAEQLEGLEITYEDYEGDFGTAHGIARTSELMLWATEATPSRQQLIDFADTVRTPPLLVCEPSHYVACKIFGGMFDVPDRSTPAKAKIEDELDFLIGFYQKQIEQHRWYGFWDWGDVMHTYDPDRHTWRYDVGGYAWANSELSPDLWLWYSYLRTGRADIFRMAEAMTRHTGEVDVYHLGRFNMLGTRHNVQHWGCSAKQLRISTPIYRRFYYFLTADERTGDLMRELLEADQTFLTLDPIRKIRKEPYQPDPRALGVGFGTDWGSLAAIWLAEWERTGEAKWRDRLLAGMRSIGQMPYGFFTSGAFYDIETGAFHVKGEPGVGVSHLGAMFGLPEVCAELIELFDEPGFEKAWLQYCELYSAPREQQQRELGTHLRGNALMNAHSRLTAYAARKKNDPQLAARAWKEFGADDVHVDIAPESGRYSGRMTRIEGPHVLNPVDEAGWVSTNDASQWSLAAIQNLALIGESLPARA